MLLFSMPHRVERLKASYMVGRGRSLQVYTLTRVGRVTGIYVRNPQTFITACGRTCAGPGQAAGQLPRKGWPKTKDKGETRSKFMNRS
jgi:hypothetical protein